MNRIAERGDLPQATDQRYEVELRNSYRKTTDTAPRPLMAEALAAAFRSSVSGFPLLFAGLFEYCNREQRARLLTILIPALSTASKVELARAGLSNVTDVRDPSPECAGDISFESIRVIAAEAARSDPSVIDRVSVFYSRVPNITKYLPTPTIAAVLAYVIRDPKLAPLDVPGTRRGWENGDEHN